MNRNEIIKNFLEAQEAETAARERKEHFKAMLDERLGEGETITDLFKVKITHVPEGLVFDQTRFAQEHKKMYANFLTKVRAGYTKVTVKRLTA